MPKYSWSELNEYPVTPAHSSAVARVIPGYQILVLKHLYAANRPDGRIGEDALISGQGSMKEKLVYGQVYHGAGRWYYQQSLHFV